MYNSHAEYGIAHPEVAIYVLISKFKFETSDKKIQWNMYNFASPSVDGHDTGPSLPMMVSRAEED